MYSYIVEALQVEPADALHHHHTTSSSAEDGPMLTIACRRHGGRFSFPLDLPSQQVISSDVAQDELVMQLISRDGAHITCVAAADSALSVDALGRSVGLCWVPLYDMVKKGSADAPLCRVQVMWEVKRNNELTGTVPMPEATAPMPEDVSLPIVLAPRADEQPTDSAAATMPPGQEKGSPLSATLTQPHSSPDNDPPGLDVTQSSVHPKGSQLLFETDIVAEDNPVVEAVEHRPHFSDYYASGTQARPAGCTVERAYANLYTAPSPVLLLRDVALSSAERTDAAKGDVSMGASSAAAAACPRTRLKALEWGKTSALEAIRESRINAAAAAAAAAVAKSDGANQDAKEAKSAASSSSALHRLKQIAFGKAERKAVSFSR